MLSIQEAARLAGVSVRTLRYYDTVGLLSPQKAENGYRCYSDADLERLQQILFYRVLRFPLKEILRLMQQPDEHRLDALHRQLHLLRQEQKRLGTLIATLEKTIQAKQGGTTMSNEEKFQGFTYEQSRAYRDEAAATYGEAAMQEAERRQAGKEQALTEGMNRVFFDFEANLQAGLPAADTQNIAVARRLHALFCTYVFDCSLDALRGIARSYVNDDRFRNNLDRFGTGVAVYARDAILAYADGAQA